MSLILASFQRPRSQLSNDAGLGFLGVHQAELQTAFAEVCKSGAMGAMGFDPLRHLAHRVEPIKTGGNPARHLWCLVVSLTPRKVAPLGLAAV